jgi:hypothetical protein
MISLSSERLLSIEIRTFVLGSPSFSETVRSSSSRSRNIARISNGQRVEDIAIRDIGTMQFLACLTTNAFTDIAIARVLSELRSLLTSRARSQISHEISSSISRRSEGINYATEQQARFLDELKAMVINTCRH